MDVQPHLDVLILAGSPSERGRTHGEALRARIRDFLPRWKDELGKSTGLDPDRYLAEFIARTKFQPAINQWVPDLLEEVRGIAEGAAADFNAIYALQLGDEEWWYRRYRKFCRVPKNGERCSSLGVFAQAGRAALIAQNMDVPKYHDGYQTLLRLKHSDSDLESLVFTSAGLIALNGVNHRGVGVCVNALLQLDHAEDGLPVAFVIRRLLEQPALPDAIEFLHDIKHASGQNYIVGGTERVVDFECSAGEIAPTQPGVTRLYHTNHPLVNDDQAMYQRFSASLTPEEKEAVAQGQGNTRVRFDFLERRMREMAAPITVADIKATLGSNEAPICRDRRHPSSVTLGCTIMELTTPPVLHLSPGPPTETDFLAFTFSTER